jgi:hypothetical protein
VFVLCSAMFVLCSFGAELLMRVLPCTYDQLGAQQFIMRQKMLCTILNQTTNWLVFSATGSRILIARFSLQHLLHQVVGGSIPAVAMV